MPYIINPTFNRNDLDPNSTTGKKPVVFDIIAPNNTSVLPDSLKMVLYANPKDLTFSYTKKTDVSQTMGGWVEYYWGDEPITITLNTVTGGFLRLGTGLSATTGAVNVKGQSYGANLGGTRRETLQYDKLLDFLALFHNNGSIYDLRGNIVMQGRIKMSFDGGVWYGWFNSFNIEEVADSPFMFNLTAVLQVEREEHTIRTKGGVLR